jgi:hypothetical protein
MKHHAFLSKMFAFLMCMPWYPTLALAQRGSAAKGDSTKPAVATPHLANGQPDLSGYWGHLAYEMQKLADPKANIVGGLEGGDGSGQAFSWWITHFETDAQIGRRAQKNRPIYKPEYWDKIRETDWNFSRKLDPSNQCLPGVPRLGMPQKIVQTPNEVVFIYESLNRYRIIPTDNRPHNKIRTAIPTWFGDSTGHWEGDTLVVETDSLIEQGWLGGTGYIHSEEGTKVTERYRRVGNTLTLQSTVEDPMLLQPWQMDPVTAQLNADPNAILMEEICEDRDSDLLLDPNNLDPTRQGH